MNYIAMIHPIPRNRNRSNLPNFHPIALLLMPSPISKSLLMSHFFKNLELHSLLSDQKHNFCSAKSTSDLFSYVTHLWSSPLRYFGVSFFMAQDISRVLTECEMSLCFLLFLPLFFSTFCCYLMHSFISGHFIAVVIV